MRVIVFSDLHGVSAAAEKIIAQNPDVRHYIYLGDGVNIIDRLAKRHHELEFHAVCGNCDYGSFLPFTDIFVVEKKKILFCHGHTLHVKFGLYELKNFARKQHADVVLFGHTHCRYAEYDDGLYVLNPGSASCPRDGKAPSYLFIDVTKGGIVYNHVEVK